MILKFCYVWFDYAFQFNFSVSLQSRLNFKSIEHWEFPRISRRRWRIILFSSFDLPNRRWQFQIVSSPLPPLSLTSESTEKFFLFEKSFSKKLKFRGWSRAASCPSRRWIGSSWPEAKKKSLFVRRSILWETTSFIFTLLKWSNNRMGLIHGGEVLLTFDQSGIFVKL